MSTQKKVLENSFLYIISSLLVKAIGFLLLPIYTSFLLPEDYGITNLVNGFINVASFIIAFSLYSAIVRFYTDYKKDMEKLKRFYGTIITFLLISGGIFISLGFVFRNILIALFFQGIFFYPVVVLALLILLFISLHTVHQNILQSMQKGKKLAVINLILFALQIGITLILISVLKLGAIGVLLTSLIINVGYSIYMIIDLKKNNLFTLCIDFKILKEALMYSIPIMPHDLSTQIANFMTQIFIKGSNSLAFVGLYSIAFQFGIIIDTVQASVNQAFAPWFYDMMNTSKPVDKKSILNLSNFLLIIYSFLYMCIGLFSQEVILLMTNEKYTLAWTVIPILVVGFSAKSIYYFHVNILFYYKNAAKKTFIATISGSVADILLAFYLVTPFGMYGAAFAFTIAKIIMVTIIVVLCKKYNHIGYRVIGMLKVILPSLIFMWIGLLLSYTKYLTVFHWGNLCYKLLILIIYLAFIYMTNKTVIHKALSSDKARQILRRIPIVRRALK